MADISGFDANDHEPNTGFYAIPAGNYPAIIIKSVMKDTKDATNDHKLLELTLQIMDGPHQNHTMKDWLNLVNSNPKTVTMAKGTLSAICRAVNIMAPKMTEELENKPLTIVVKTKKVDGEFRNEIDAYKPHSVSVATPAPKEHPKEMAESTSGGKAKATSASPFG